MKGANPPKADQRIRNDVLNTHAQRRHLDVLHNEFEHEDGDAARHTTSEGGEAEKEDDTGLPSDAGTGVAPGIRAEALLLDAVDDEHAEGGEDEGEPVDEGDVDVLGAVLGGMGPDGGVEHDVEGEGELEGRAAG